MSKTILSGFLLIFSSGVLFVFKFVGHLMNKEMHIFTISELFGVEWINSIPWSAAQELMIKVADLPMALILLAVGVIVIILSAFQK